MKQFRWTLMLVVVLALIGLFPGCSENEQPGATNAANAGAPATSDADRSARALSIPGQSGTGAGDPHAGVGSNVLTWDTPAGWTPVQPRSNMRFAQFSTPGEGECIVYYFGPGQGGDAMSNAQRWAGQFKQPDGSSSVDKMKVAQLEGAKLPVMVVEVTGVYDGGMTMTDAPAESQQNHMLLGGIAEGPDAPWFFKFTGPEKTIRAEREAFEGMMRTLRPGG